MRELLTAIGLEALYHANNAQAFKVGAPAFSKEIFIRGNLVMYLQQTEFLKALQLGVQMTPVQVMSAPPEKRLKLVH